MTKTAARAFSHFAARLRGFTAIVSFANLWLALGHAAVVPPPVGDQGTLTFASVAEAKFKFGGGLGQRIDANADHWLLRAPQANPGMLEMFRLRDRQPAPSLVPWAGEFVGKYLLSAIAALRMSDDPALETQVRAVIRELIAVQAEDGYLGPFPKAIRLKTNWDLWGHYHVMQALMLWHETTGDEAALNACRRAADLICRTFLDAPQRIFDAGSHEMNMAVLHGLGQLYRLTATPDYLRMMREIEKDWERAGDYLRTGLAGLEFFQTPRPRWESLHDVQGLVELYRISGDPRYRSAFEHHWRSIARWDRHNTGGFSSGEQATGNPYSPGAIETCCTVAWMALSLDMLRLTGDPLVADELELSTFNGAAGAQHPSGRWWTYNTPMDGTREASAHSIVFQARAGTPELNCCSVNAPRSLGMLSEWAVMTDPSGWVVNYYGPAQFHGRLPDQTAVSLRWDTDYPLTGRVRIVVEPSAPRDFTLKLRVPAWSATTMCRCNGQATAPVRAGRYLELKRRWEKSDTVDLDFDMAPRFVPGDRETAGKVSLYRGPLLLAYDQKHNDFDEVAIPAIDLARLMEAKPITRAPSSSGAPWLLLDVPAASNRALRLCDFASAGAAGTRYRSWLPAQHCPPPAVVTRSPADAAIIPVGRMLFKWTGPGKTGEQVSEYRLTVAETADWAQPLIELKGLSANRVLLEEDQMRRLQPQRLYYWKVTAVNAHGATDSVRPAARFSIDPALPAAALPSSLLVRNPDALLLQSTLRGDPKPQVGEFKDTKGYVAAEGPDGQAQQAIALDGRTQMLRYSLEEFPDEDYSVALRVRFTELPSNHLGQVISAWCAPMDDPLRLCVEQGKLFARIEAGQNYGTTGVPVRTGRWYHLASVKSAGRLTLFVDGNAVASVSVPAFLRSNARDIALGGNPHYGGNEFLQAQLADFAFYGRSLSSNEVALMAKGK